MRKILGIISLLGLMTGCSWFSSSDTSEATTPQAPIEAATEAAQPEPEAAPEPVKSRQGKKAEKAEKTSAKTAKAKSAKGVKSEAQIKAELDQVANRLVAKSSRTLLPNKANKDIRQVGGQWVATYNEVDTKNVSTEMQPGSTPGVYVGIIQYYEKIFECRGATKQAAASAPCDQARSRRMRELISYDGKKWNE